MSFLCVAAISFVLSRPGFTRPEGIKGQAPHWAQIAAPISWTITGAVLIWLRPKNRVGVLILAVGVFQAVSQAAGAYGMYGVGIAQPQWPLARWVAYFGIPLWVPGLLPLVNILVAIYPDGRLPGPRWRIPVIATSFGIAVLTVAMLGGYNDIVPGPSPINIQVSTVVFGPVFVLGALCLVGGTVSIWVMSIVRLVRSPTPQRQQLAWLLCAVIPVFLVGTLGPWQSLFIVFIVAVPAAIAVGVLWYHMLDIEVVLRRGFVYAVLTGAVIALYAAVTSVAGSSAGHGALPGVVAAAIVAVGLTPVRERLQRAVDRVLYGDRRDPMRAVTQVGASVSASEDHDLLPAVLVTVTEAVHAPGAVVLSPSGRVVAALGCEVNESVSVPLRVGGRDVGCLRLAVRRPGELYTDGDLRLLAALAPQVAVVVRALDLAEALESERDRVLEATRAERDRLRRDLHDGLGPSLSGVGLGLQALATSRQSGDDRTSAEILERVRAEVATAVDDVRRILDDLRPAALDEAPFEEALRRYVGSAAGGIHIDLVLPALLPSLPRDVETAAFRIAQEALTNVVRHAGARTARLVLAASPNSLCVEVKDDGEGFKPQTKSGVGLASMRHRAEHLGGSLTIDTGPGGTTVVATLPLNKPSLAAP